MCTRRIPCGSCALLAILLLSIPALTKAAGAQETTDRQDTSATTVQSLDGELLDKLPADRVDPLLALRPGISSTNLGQPSLRGSGPRDAALYLDGVPLLTGFRESALFRSGPFTALDARATPGTNALRVVEVTTGPLAASLGNGRAGAISYRPRIPTGPLRGTLRYETDEVSGSGVGFNRVEGSFGGAPSSHLSFFAAGVLEGQRGASYGFTADRAPVFVPMGVDTVVSVPDPSSSSGAMVPYTVYNYAVSRGGCAAFAGSANGGIADNYGRSCDGALTPGSTVSSYQLLGRASYALGLGASVTALALANQEQNRNFDYGNLENPQALTGNRGTSVVYALSLRQPLQRSPNGSVVLDAYISYQRDRELSGPLAPEAAADLDAPFGGFTISPLRHRFDFESFPVDEELVRNYRLNTPGSRRSPFDLENRAQYALVDRYRNNAYGLYNRAAPVPLLFYDGGGPEGPLTLYRESRWVVGGAADWALSEQVSLRLGGELARHSIGSYSHNLTDQAFSDVYLEQPVRSALFLDGRLRLGPGSVSVGLRFDRYRTGARRAEFPVISTHPLFDPNDPDAYLETLPEDEAHARVSPRLQLGLPIGRTTTVRTGYAQQVQVPDLRQVLAGINTDINLTSVDQIFGSDLDFERTHLYEIGLHHRLGERTTLDVAAYLKQNRGSVVPRFVRLPDPTSASEANVLRYLNEGRENIRGLDVRLDRRFGSELSASIAYSYQNAVTTLVATTLSPEFEHPMAGSRPHLAAGVLAVQLPPDWRQGSTLGSIFKRLSVFATLRAASGTPYNECASRVALSSESCFEVTSLNGARLPSYKQLDLRLTKGFALGGRTLTAYVDARNLLGTRNVLAVFSSTGETASPESESVHRAQALDEYAREAQISGALLPDGSMDLRFGGLSDPRAGCGTWMTEAGIPAAPNCVHLIRAEERFGDGDHIFDIAEQTRAANALYQVMRGEQNLTGAPRRVRLGFELTF
jgi:hypothetical protein